MQTLVTKAVNNFGARLALGSLSGFEMWPPARADPARDLIGRGLLFGPERRLSFVDMSVYRPTSYGAICPRASPELWTR